MKENIETKDVQRTEYLDKNGLDMLWAKVKENTQNQVEVERDRATTQENRIIDTKADKSELHSSYVSNSTFTALQEKVAANTDAISDKQDAGNYLSYETINNEGYYEIPDIRIPGSGGNTKTDIDSQSISVNCDYPASHTTITCDGISNTDNNANHVYATDGSIADLTQYIKKGDTDVKFVPYVKKDLNSYNSGEAYYLGNYIQFGGSQEYHTVIGSTAFDARYGNHRTNLNVDSTADYAVDISNLGTSRSVKVVWDTMKLAFTPEDNNVDSGTTYSLAGIHLPANLSSKKPENTLVLGTDEDYKEIGVDIAPLENDKVPTKYLTSATKESLGVVKVGDGLNVTDGTISVDSTAIGTGNYIPYRDKWMDWYNLPYDASLKFQKNESTPDSAIVRPGAIETMHYDTTNKINTTISIGGNENYYFKGIRLYTNGDNRVTLDDHSLTIFDGNGSNVYDVVKLNADGIKLHNGDNNHVLTSNASTIDITQYVLKSVYDEKIAALEARIAALEAKHTETA